MSTTREQETVARIQPEHRTLDSYFDDTKGRLTGADGTVACRQLREALEIHFDQEESLYFPVVRRLCPDLNDKISGFAAAHAGFLSQLDSTIAFLEAGEESRAEERFAALQSGFARHELSEESMIESIGNE